MSPLSLYFDMHVYHILQDAQKRNAQKNLQVFRERSHTIGMYLTQLPLSLLQNKQQKTQKLLLITGITFEKVEYVELVKISTPEN